MEFTYVILGFVVLMAVGSHVSDWLDGRSRRARQAARRLVAYEELLAELECEAREYRLIDNFADITAHRIEKFRAEQATPRKKGIAK